jgi:hypothetical protein
MKWFSNAILIASSEFAHIFDFQYLSKAKRITASRNFNRISYLSGKFSQFSFFKLFAATYSRSTSDALITLPSTNPGHSLITMLKVVAPIEGSLL